MPGTATLADRALKDPGENAAKLMQRSFPHPRVMTADLVQHLLRLWRRLIAQQLAATARLQKVRPVIRVRGDRRRRIMPPDEGQPILLNELGDGAAHFRAFY
jgi:hypothetical protein